jgi:hypothetical protein
MKNPFTKHPHSINETYLRHMIEALKYCIQFILLSIMTFVHAVFPFLFVNTSSKLIKKINKHLENRRSNNDKS